MALKFWVLGVGLGAFMTQLTLADDYLPKETPPLHEQNVHRNSSALVLSALAGVGQAYSTQGESRPGLAALVGGEIGYQAALGLWSRLIPSVQLFAGQLNYRVESDQNERISIPVKLGGIAQLAYGQAVGPNSFVMGSVGVGLANVGFEIDPEGGQRAKTTDPLLSGLLRAGINGILGLGDNLDLLGNINWTHWAFDVDEVEAGNVRQNISQPINLNIIEVQFGLRLRL